MNVELWIRGGTVVDPARNLERAADVLVRRGVIVDPPLDGRVDAEQVIDARDCLVLPGLIDSHAHLYWGGSELGIEPDAGLLPQGVTTAVDAGSAGIANYSLFSSSVVARSTVRVKSLLHVSPAGLVTVRYLENVDPCHYDPERAATLFDRHRGELVGLKIRQSRDVVGGLGLEPLRATLRLAESLQCPVVVHVTNPPGSPAAIADLLRRRDVFCHAYHGTGPTILDRDGRILPEVRAARSRGVVFDSARGRKNFALAVAREALRHGFPPDVISTDVTRATLFRAPVFGLPHVMSEHLALGMPLLDVVAACTSTPAHWLGLMGEIGTLAPGACGDVAVFRQVKTRVTFTDARGETMVGERLLVPQMTVRAGQVVYRQPTL